MSSAALPLGATGAKAMTVDVHTYESVWDAIADDAGEAANLKLRARLMDALEEYIGRERITQAEAAKRFGVR